MKNDSEMELVLFIFVDLSSSLSLDRVGVDCRCYKGFLCCGVVEVGEPLACKARFFELAVVLWIYFTRFSTWKLVV